jgi:hypothetical protein
MKVKELVELLHYWGDLEIITPVRHENGDRIYSSLNIEVVPQLFDRHNNPTHLSLLCKEKK